MKKEIVLHILALLGLALLYFLAAFCGVYATTKNGWAASAAGCAAAAAFFDPKSGQGSKQQLAQALDDRVNGRPETPPT